MKKIKLIEPDIVKLKKILYCPHGQGRFLVIDYYIVIVLFLYPVYMSDSTIFGIFHEKNFIFSFLTLLTGIFLTVAILCRTLSYKKILSRVDLSFLIIVLLLTTTAIYKMIQGDPDFEQETFLACLIIMYFVLRGVRAEYQYYVRLFLYASIFLYIGILGYLLTGTDSWLGIEIMFRQPGAVPSFLLLACGCSSLMYCLYDEDGWKTFYLILSGVGFASIFLYWDMVTVCLMGLFLLTIPIVFSPTVKLVKKNLILCFLFLFVGSNIPLLQTMEWVKIEHPYDLRYSVYIDLFLAVMGVIICQYWSKIPQNIDSDKVVMRKFRKWYIQALALSGSILLSCLLMGERLNALPDKWGVAGLKLFGSELRRSVAENESFIHYLLAEYGIIGCILWILLGILVIKRLIRQWQKTDCSVKLMCMIGILFWIQSFVYQVQPETAPVYVIFLTFALCADRTEEQTAGDEIRKDYFIEEGNI